MQESQKRIVLCVCGSIAIYKSVHLARLLRDKGFVVDVVMTASATQFIKPVVFSSLVNGGVFWKMIREQKWENYIEVGANASCIVVAPATMNIIGKMANGICDNMVLAVIYSSRCPVFVFPAMEENMWYNEATQRNVSLLRERGIMVYEPEFGVLASGKTGRGRMWEPQAIVDEILSYFEKRKVWENVRVMITGGPTQEPIDSVRYISNASSGKMAYYMLRELTGAAKHITLIHGPSPLLESFNGKDIKKISVQTSKEMYEACMRESPNHDVIIMCAAVADFTPQNPHHGKIKKEGMDTLTLQLKKTKDIISEIGRNRRPGVVIVGFALEDEINKEHAITKMNEKGMDIIIQNSAGGGSGPSSDFVRFLCVSRNGNTLQGYMHKREAARHFLDFIGKFIEFNNRNKG